MNKVLFSGFLGSAPQTKELPSGASVVEFSVGVREGKDSTLWYDCSDWRSSNSTKVYEHFSKGSGITVDGRLGQPRAFMRKDGTPGAALQVRVENVYFPPIRKDQAGQATSAAASGNAVAVDDGDEGATPF